MIRINIRRKGIITSIELHFLYRGRSRGIYHLTKTVGLTSEAIKRVALFPPSHRSKYKDEYLIKKDKNIQALEKASWSRLGHMTSSHFYKRCGSNILVSVVKGNNIKNKVFSPSKGSIQLNQVSSRISHQVKEVSYTAFTVGRRSSKPEKCTYYYKAGSLSRYSRGQCKWNLIKGGGKSLSYVTNDYTVEILSRRAKGVVRHYKEGYTMSFRYLCHPKTRHYLRSTVRLFNSIDVEKPFASDADILVQLGIGDVVEVSKVHRRCDVNSIRAKEFLKWYLRYEV